MGIRKEKERLPFLALAEYGVGCGELEGKGNVFFSIRTGRGGVIDKTVMGAICGL